MASFSRSECNCRCFLLSMREQSMMYNLPLQGTQEYLANIQTQSLGVVEKIEVSVLVSLCEANQETCFVSLLKADGDVWPPSLFERANI